jgi:ABC-type transport system involved in cytochrome bd biosynthesis fused ATPase/permease subunit
MGLLFRYLFDQAIPNHDLMLIALAGAAIILLYVSSDVVTIALRFGTLRVSKQVTQHLREELVGKIYTFSRSLHSHTDLSKPHASIVQDTERVDVMSNLFTAQLLPVVVSALVLSIASLFSIGSCFWLCLP